MMETLGILSTAIAWELFEKEQRETYEKWYCAQYQYVEEQAYELAYYRGEIETPWKEEYKAFTDSNLELEHWSTEQELHLSRELLKHKRYQYKRKHKKDHKTWVWHNGDCWWEIQFKTHKHKRAEKIFEKEAYDIYFCYVWDEDWFDWDGDYWDDEDWFHTDWFDDLEGY